MISGPRIVVVGGGLAGIAAALAAADAGAAVTLLEARPRLGGATHSFTRDGRSLDNGQHVFLRCCTAYRGLLQRLAVTHLTALQSRLSIPVLSPGHRPAQLSRSGLPAPLHLAGSLLRYPLLCRGERARAVGAVAALRRLDPDDPALDEVTFGDWLAAHGQSTQAVTALWDLVTTATLNVRPEAASLALAVKVFRTGLLARADAADIGWSAVPLGRLHGDAADRALSAAGVTVTLRSKVTAVTGTAVHVDAVHVDDQVLSADAVVLAVPHDRVAALLPAALADLGRAADALGSSPIVNLHVCYDRWVTELRFAAAVHTPVQWVFDRTASAGADGGQYLAVSLSAADGYIDTPTAVLREEFLPALAELFPAACSARVTGFTVTRERTATFRQVAGSRRLRPPSPTAVPGLYLAGAWTDTGWPATMEGAVRSGLSATRAALADLGQLRPRSGVAA